MLYGKAQGMKHAKQVQGVLCLSGYLFTSMHLSQIACAIGLLRKMEGELEKQHAFTLVGSDRAQAGSQHA